MTEETLDYVLREMTDPEGGFYSAQDADSEGEEGKFFVWTPEEIQAVLGRDAGTRSATGASIRGRTRGQDTSGAGRARSRSRQPARRRLCRRASRACIRARRQGPGGLERSGRRRSPRRAGPWSGATTSRRPGATSFVLGAMRETAGCWDWKAGRAKLKGYLEDHAMMAAARWDVYEATFERRWLDEAQELGETMLRLFWDEGVEGFYDTGSDHEALIVRPRNLFDNAVPSGSSVAIETLLRLKVFTGEAGTRQGPGGAPRMADLMARHPSGFGRFLCALDFYLGPVLEVALVAPAAAIWRRCAREVFGRYLPNRVVVGTQTETPGTPGVSRSSRDVDAVEARPTAFVCRNYACELRRPIRHAGPPARRRALRRTPGRPQEPGPARRYLRLVRRGGRIPRNRVRPGTPRT